MYNFSNIWCTLSIIIVRNDRMRNNEYMKLKLYQRVISHLYDSQLYGFFNSASHELYKWKITIFYHRFQTFFFYDYQSFKICLSYCSDYTILGCFTILHLTSRMSEGITVYIWFDIKLIFLNINSHLKFAFCLLGYAFFYYIRLHYVWHMVW